MDSRVFAIDLYWLLRECGVESPLALIREASTAPATVEETEGLPLCRAIQTLLLPQLLHLEMGHSQAVP